MHSIELARLIQADREREVAARHHLGWLRRLQAEARLARRHEASAAPVEVTAAVVRPAASPCGGTTARPVAGSTPS